MAAVAMAHLATVPFPSSHADTSSFSRAYRRASFPSFQRKTPLPLLLAERSRRRANQQPVPPKQPPKQPPPPSSMPESQSESARSEGTCTLSLPVIRNYSRRARLVALRTLPCGAVDDDS